MEFRLTNPVFQRRFLCAIAVVMVSWGVTPHHLRADQPAHSPVLKTSSTPDTATLLSQLDSPEFSQRVSAQQELSHLGEESPEKLLEIYRVADEEVRARILQLLEGIFLSCDDERGDQAERALDEIGISGSARAESILAGNARLRESRARKAIERLGGQLTYVHPGYRAVSVAPLVGVGFGDPSVLQSILIPEDWKGTRDDLWQIRRLGHHQNLTLYNIRGSHVEHDDLLQLVAALPGLTIAERGACLGIKAIIGSTTAEVSEVVEHSAAAAAGLQPNDRIEKLDGENVRNFSHLVELLLQYTPGDEVLIEVSRNGKVLEIPVKLASWKDVPQSETRAVPAPTPFPGPLGIGTPPPPLRPEPAPQIHHQLQFN